MSSGESEKRDGAQVGQGGLALVIDMQNVYLPGEAWGCPTLPRTCERIMTVLDAVEKGRNPPAVRFTRFLNNPDGTGMWARYNEVNRRINENPWMSELIDAMKPYARRYPLCTKSVYSSLRIPQIRRLARRTGRVAVMGVVSECCVLSTCMEAIDMGCHVFYLKDACSGGDAQAERAVLKVLAGLSPLHVTLLDAADYIREWF